MPIKLLPPITVAQLLNVSRKVIYRRIAAGKIPHEVVSIERKRVPWDTDNKCVAGCPDLKQVK